VTIPVVDFFAGPGGLGEGFSAFSAGKSGRPFRIALSVEKDPAAHATLQLRAFLRRFEPKDVPAGYYQYAAGKAANPADLVSAAEWRMAEQEALNAALGDPAGDEAVATRLEGLRLKGKVWVLIGGPPCQAYSLVGRARNAGKDDYRPENDARHFLYQHYLRVLDELHPPVFVMENVKGILSASVSGRGIFAQILRDLSQPSISLRGPGSRGVRYRIRAVSSSALMNPGADPAEIDWHDYVVRAEQMGLPQSRHRVILIGVRHDLDPCVQVAASAREPANLGAVIGGLPRLRSGLSEGDSVSAWREQVLTSATKVCKWLDSRLPGVNVKNLSRLREADLPSARQSSALPRDANLSRTRPDLASWYRDPLLRATLNHDARSHMASDLTRYLYCAAWAAVTGRSPRPADFPGVLAPDHESWGTGAFVDRFRVQQAKGPATTVTSHIAKDGHYFIHYDPLQCRSLTVREAARIQTFPDNYLFEGNRTQQYVQVGNAVPPLVAVKIAGLVHQILRNA
jgi:DNA (cytosine-5)-methyltransferase 1